MTKINFILGCLILAFLAVAIFEMRRFSMLVERMSLMVYDLDLEVSKVTATNGYLGYIGERGGVVSVNGEKVARKK